MKVRSILWKYLIITIGSVLYALSFNLFLTPMHIAPGGISGIAIVINYLTLFPVGIMILILNIPLFILSYVKFGGAFLFSSFFATALGSVIIDLTSKIPPFTNDPILASIYGGILMGAGLGLVFDYGATTGGSDILSRLIKLRFPHISMGRMMLCVDFVVITISALVFRNMNSALYAVITLYISSKVIDVIIYGTDYEKLAYIISDKSDEITNKIQEELGRGVTLLYGEGGYTNRQKKVIMCALKRQQSAKAAEIASSIDSYAFVIVVDAHEILGDGFERKRSW
ncbi:MAG: YitT family protein [Clostridiales bacterium]|nr:YitT family protein [Clostridiales bacterium]